MTLVVFFLGLMWSFREVPAAPHTVRLVCGLGSPAYLGLFFLGRRLVNSSEAHTSLAARAAHLVGLVLFAAVNIGLWGVMLAILTRR